MTHFHNKIIIIHIIVNSNVFGTLVTQVTGLPPLGSFAKRATSIIASTIAVHSKVSGSLLVIIVVDFRIGGYGHEDFVEDTQIEAKKVSFD